jgi:hypothetical protein
MKSYIRYHPLFTKETWLIVTNVARKLICHSDVSTAVAIFVMNIGFLNSIIVLVITNIVVAQLVEITLIVQDTAIRLKDKIG